jgi:hypothetical protein
MLKLNLILISDLRSLQISTLLFYYIDYKIYYDIKLIRIKFFTLY